MVTDFGLGLIKYSSFLFYTFICIYLFYFPSTGILVLFGESSLV